MSTVNTKIIFLKGEKADLPEQLDAGELALTTDDGTLVIGSDPSFGQANIDRQEFPYRNVEILTERAEGTFAKMHGDRMREGTEYDYYDSRLEPDRLKWTPVLIDNDGEYTPYRIEILNSVSAFIDYAVTENDLGEPVRDGQLIVWFNQALPDAQFTDKSSMPRDRNLTNPSNYDPRQVFEKVKFRFSLSEDQRYLEFQYKNYTFDFLCLQFRVSRPYGEQYQTAATAIVAEMEAQVKFTYNIRGTALGIFAIREVDITNNVTLLDKTESRSERDTSSPYRYWRVKVGDREVIDYNQQSFNEVEFHETVGGPDISQDAEKLMPNSILLPAPYDADHIPARLFDGNLTTRYHGYHPDFDNANPMCAPHRGMILDFGTPRVVQEVAFYKANSREDFSMPQTADNASQKYANWYTYSQEYAQNQILASNDGLNWGLIYQDALRGLGSNQWRYIPDRPIPVGTTWGCSLSGQAPTDTAHLSSIQYFDENDQPITDLTIGGRNFGYTSAFYDNNVTTEASITAAAQVYFDSPKRITRIVVTGPNNILRAPLTLTFQALKTVLGSTTRALNAQYYGPITFTNLTNWTPRQVRSFNVSLT